MSNVKFLHYRRWEEVVVGERVGMSPTARQGATVAYMVGPTGSNYAIAYCGPHDNYSKALGRAKSSGRLLSERYAEANNIKDPKEFISFMDKAMEFEQYSRRGAAD